MAFAGRPRPCSCFGMNTSSKTPMVISTAIFVNFITSGLKNSMFVYDSTIGPVKRLLLIMPDKRFPSLILRPERCNTMHKFLSLPWEPAIIPSLKPAPLKACRTGLPLTSVPLNFSTAFPKYWFRIILNLNPVLPIRVAMSPM